ncbi:MAG: 4-phosphoerythronate dehydrogenase [Bacteroidaceae bacterium]|nr:4-phosphoerythronate dehydrogenase [Bacteroidaceae bacterium]
MKIIVDDKIPYVKGQIEQLGTEVLYLSGSKISREDVRDADILLVRTRTHCNRELLEGSRVRFVVTATIGYDHLDTAYLAEAGIAWTNSPGCNATSVGQYVRNTLFLLERERGLKLREATLGIVGVGHVGSAVREACQPWVGNILLNDPPKGLPVTLSEIQQKCDIITFHTPLVTDGEWPTYHLAGEAFFQGLAKRPVVINAARGEVVDNVALEKALDEGRICEAVVDTWENEPRLSRALLNKVYIGTPHIAGYSADGKANASRMSLEAIAGWMVEHGCLEASPVFSVVPPAVPEGCVPTGDAVEDALRLYDPRQDSQRLKDTPDGFEQQRGNYPLRREQFR